MKRISLFLFMVFALMNGQMIFADQKGQAIAQKMYDLPEGKTQIGKSVMAIIPKGRKPQIKEFSAYEKEYGEKSRSRSIFTKPSHIEFLSWSEPGKDSQQWIKLSGSSVRKIGSSDKSASFVGSHFYYADLSKNSIDDFQHTYLGEKKIGDDDCYKIKAVRIRGTKVYEYAILYIRKSDYFTKRIDFFEKQGHTKTLINSNIEKVDGILVARKMEMLRADGSGKTIIYLKAVTFNKAISDSFFSKEAL